MEQKTIMPEQPQSKSRQLLSGFFLFLFNGLVFLVIFCVIKEVEREKLVKTEKISEEKQEAVAEKIIENQRLISEDRELKLRDLNNTPNETTKYETVNKEIKVPVAPTPAVKKKSDAKTKTS